MMMPLQRQSDQYSIFDDGTPRYARDRASTELPRGLAGLINTSGPRIQAGLLNTRQAAGYGFGPADHGGAGPDGGPAVPDWFYDGDSEDYYDPDLESLDENDPANYLHPDDIEHSPTAEPFDTPIYNPRSAPYDNITGSRLPFVRSGAEVPITPQPIPGGGYQRGHRVGFDWRENTITGTVIGLDGNQVAVRWDDGQHSSEEPHNIHLI